ncbi:uncharacterized protein LOC129754379 isoform X2 [Uranotaenia lowii]|nr:uncharacterized protein LOC129754379 isoform X2 [Uranotaenia lowii]
MPPGRGTTTTLTTTQLYINISILSLGLNAVYVAYLVNSGHLYDTGKCWSSHVVLLLPAIELLKDLFVRKAFMLDGAARASLTSGITSTTGSSKNAKGTTKKSSPLGDSGGIVGIIFGSIVFYAFVCLILGAPLDQYEETVSLASVLTSLTIFPIVLFLGHTETMRLLFSESLELRSSLANGYLNLLKNNCIGVILGAWGASVVAPLDWDRPWQVYPVPNVVGAIAGAFGMNVFTLLSTTYFALTNDRRKRGMV